MLLKQHVLMAVLHIVGASAHGADKHNACAMQVGDISDLTLLINGCATKNGVQMQHENSMC